MDDATKKTQIQEDNFLSVLVASDELSELGPKIRSVLEAGKEKDTLSNLKIFIKAREEEIEKICRNNAYNLLRSINEIKDIKENVAELKASILQVNKEMQSIGNDFVAKAKELEEYRVISKNLDDTIEMVHRCQYALKLFTKVKDAIKMKNFYQVIKTLEQADRVHLPLIAHTELGRYLSQKIVQMKEAIKWKVTKNLNEWLTNIRDRSIEIGAFVITQTRHELEREEKFSEYRRQMASNNNDNEPLCDTDGKKFKINEKLSESFWSMKSDSVSVSVFDKNFEEMFARHRKILLPQKFYELTFKLKATNSSNSSTITHNTDSDNNVKKEGEVSQKATNDSEDVTQVNVFDKLKISFTPLYQCFCIYDSLGLGAEFRKYYKDNRKLQLRQVLQPLVLTTSHTTSSSLSETVGLLTSRDSFRNYFHDICGYFVVEEHVLRTTEELILRTDIAKYWEKTMGRIKIQLLSEISNCDSPPLLSDLKDFLLLFCETMKQFGYDASSLSEFSQQVIRDRFFEVIVNLLANFALDLLKADQLVPLKIDKEEDYESLIVKNQLMNLALNTENSISPATNHQSQFPFSLSVPLLCHQIKKTINDVHFFCRNIPGNDTSNAIVKTTEQIISNTIQLMWDVILQRDDVSLSSISQMLVNLTHFNECVPMFGKYLFTQCRIAVENVTVGLNVSKKYKETCDKLQERLLHIAQQKILALLNQHKWDWTSTTRLTTHHDYIVEVENLISEHILKLNLPHSMLANLESQVYRTVANQFMGYLLSPTVKRISLEVLEGMKLDVEHFVSAAKIFAKAKNQISDIFLELQQLLNLLTCTDPKSAFLEPSTRNKDYFKLTSAERLISALSKCCGDKSLAFISKSPTNLRTKSIKSLIKHLQEKGLTL